MVCWRIGGNRNETWHDDSCKSAQEVLQNALEFLNSFRSANGQTLTYHDVGGSLHKWSPPLSGMLKGNFDGAIFKENGFFGCRVVIRDARGLFVAGLSKKIKANGHLCMQSAWQFGRLSFLLKQFWKEIPLEAINGIQCSSNTLAPVSLFRKVEYNVVCRTRNCVACHLARNAIFSLNCNLWMEVAPEFIMSFRRYPFS